MSKNVNHIQHVKSNVVEEGQPKLPQSSVLVDGELAINYASGYETISIKNSDGTIKRFSSDDYYTEQKLGSGFTGVNSANTVTKVIEDNELAISSSLNDLNSRKLDASAYTPTDLSDYYTKSETSGKTEISTALGSKANSSDLNAYADSVKYNSTSKYVEFYHGGTGGTKVFEYDASPFIIDGMVQNVEIKDVASSGTCLVVSFNTDAGKQDINIPISDIFDANNYYNKTAIDNLVGSGFTSSSITDVIISDERITAAALNDLNANKLDASAMTEISTALSNKADVSAFTAHTASTVHMTSTEKTNLDSLATNIGAISGITSAKVTSWDNAVNDLSALTADVSGQSETVAAALNVLNDSIDNINDKFEGVDVVIEQKTKVTAIALNDLDDRIVSANNSINGLSDNVAEINDNLGGLKFKRLTQQEYNTLMINDEIDDFTLYITIDTNGYDYVEIGGIKWATMNVGATAITDTGLYFQWGDTSGYTASQVGSGEGEKYFGWADYKFNPSGDGLTMTKYNSTDGLNKLKNADDSVRANMGGQWRMPTEAEFQSLINATTTAWTSSYEGSGVAGIIFTDKNDNSKVLFFPAAGYCNDGSVHVGSEGNYWSSSLYTSDVVNGRNLYFSNDGNCLMYASYRYNGYSVRGVVG